MKNNLKTIALIVGIVLILSAASIVMFMLKLDTSFKAILTGVCAIFLLMLVDSLVIHIKALNKPF